MDYILLSLLLNLYAEILTPKVMALEVGHLILGGGAFVLGDGVFDQVANVEFS